MLRRLLLAGLLLAAPAIARAERVHVWIENADIPTSSTSVTSTIVPESNNTYRWLGFRDGAGTDATLRRARIPFTVPGDAGTSFNVRLWITVGGHCSTDSAHCWLSGVVGCTGGICITENPGGVCAWKVYLDAYPNGAALTSGPAGSGATVSFTPADYPLTMMHATSYANAVPLNNQANGGAACSGSQCQGAYAFVTLDLVSASTTYEYCDVREVELDKP